MKINKIKKIGGALLLFSIATLSFSEGSSLGLVRGFSGNDSMDGFALTYKSYWGVITHFKNDWELGGYWDSELAYWKTNNSLNTYYSNITILSLTPNLRYIRQTPYENGITPFFDLGFGFGLMNQKQFSNNQLGGYATFRQSFGGGIQFGDESQYDLSYHYIIYNNAGQFREDDGLYINTIEFDYKFSVA